MNIYQHDLWFVSRFEDNMLIFQVSRSNSFQTKTEISCKTNTGNRLFRGIQRDSFLLSSFIKHSRVLHAEGCPVSPGGARVKDLSSWTEIRFSTNEDSSTQCVHLHAWFQNHMSYRKPHSGSYAQRPETPCQCLRCIWTVLLSAVPITCGHPRSRSVKWKIPEIIHTFLFACHFE